MRIVCLLPSLSHVLSHVNGEKNKSLESHSMNKYNYKIINNVNISNEKKELDFDEHNICFQIQQS